MVYFSEYFLVELLTLDTFPSGRLSSGCRLAMGHSLEGVLLNSGDNLVGGGLFTFPQGVIDELVALLIFEWLCFDLLEFFLEEDMQLVLTFDELNGDIAERLYNSFE